MGAPARPPCPGPGATGPEPADPEEVSRLLKGLAQNPSSSEELRVLALLLQRPPDHPQGQALGVPLAGEHARRGGGGACRGRGRGWSAACGRPARGRSPPPARSRAGRRPRRSASESTPLVRSSRASARRASPRPWCRDSTQASANAASSISPTSSNRESTSSATSSGISRLRRASASCLRVRGVPVSSRRQIARARSAGSSGLRCPRRGRPLRPRPLDEARPTRRRAPGPPPCRRRPARRGNRSARQPRREPRDVTAASSCAVIRAVGPSTRRRHRPSSRTGHWLRRVTDQLFAAAGLGRLGLRRSGHRLARRSAAAAPPRPRRAPPRAPPASRRCPASP